MLVHHKNALFCDGYGYDEDAKDFLTALVAKGTNDLALIELATPVTLENVVSLPKLEKANNYYSPEQKVISIGYGFYDKRCDLFNQNQYCVVSYPVLRSGKMKIMPDDQIKWEDMDGFPFSNANPFLSPPLFVGTFSFNGNQTPTNFDSGSPLLIKDSTQYIIIGTDSSGVSTAQKFQVEVYTRLATQENLDWIRSVVKQKVKSPRQ